MVWLEMLRAVAVQLPEDIGQGITRPSQQRGIHVEHCAVFSGLSEILFKDWSDTGRGNLDALEHPDKRPPEREQRGARDVFTRTRIYKINERPQSPEEQRRKLGDIPRHEAREELPSMAPAKL